MVLDPASNAQSVAAMMGDFLQMASAMQAMGTAPGAASAVPPVKHESQPMGDPSKAQSAPEINNQPIDVGSNTTLNNTLPKKEEQEQTPSNTPRSNTPSNTLFSILNDKPSTTTTTSSDPGAPRVPARPINNWFDDIVSVLGFHDGAASATTSRSKDTTFLHPPSGLSASLDVFKTEIRDDTDRQLLSSLLRRDTPIPDLLTFDDDTHDLLIALSDTESVSDSNPFKDTPVPTATRTESYSETTVNWTDEPTATWTEPRSEPMDAPPKTNERVPLKMEKMPAIARVKAGFCRSPQVDHNPLNLAQAPSDVQSRVLRYMKEIQSLTWEEASMPRVFIVLPNSCPQNDQYGLSSASFRFFWMCEHSCDHPDGADDQSRYGSSPYLETIHQGYVLDRPSEFFNKFGVHLLSNLQLFMYSRRSAAGWSEGSKSASVGYDQGVEFLRRALEMTSKQQVEKCLDWMISHLLSLTIESMMESQLHPQLGAANIRPTHLEQHNLYELRSFLIGSSGMEENLYRSVDEDGQVQWVCFTHYYELHPFFFPGYIQSAVEKCGGYNYGSQTTTPVGVYSPKVGQVSVQPRSSNEALDLFSSLVAGSGCVPDLVLRLTWDVGLSDMKDIRDAVLCFGVVSLVLTGPGLQTASDGHAELMVQILEHRRVQSFSLESAQGILKYIHPLMLMDKPFEGLRTLRLTIDSVLTGAEDVDSGVISVVMNSPNLKSLSINWEAMEEFISVESFLRAISGKEGSSLLEVSLIVRQQTIMLTMDRGELHNVNVQSADLAIAGTNPLVSSGLVHRLKVVNPTNVLDEYDTLQYILSTNHGLHTLELDCDVDTFQNVLPMVNGIVGLLPQSSLSNLFLMDSTRSNPTPVYQASIVNNNRS